jgi:hypothetical protein
MNDTLAHVGSIHGILLCQEHKSILAKRQSIYKLKYDKASVENGLKFAFWDLRTKSE